MNSQQAAALVSARIDRLPSSAPLWKLVFRISFGAFFEIYETALTSLLAPVLVTVGIFHTGKGGLFGLPDLATFAFATFAGLFAGALLFYRRGRPLRTPANLHVLPRLVRAGDSGDELSSLCHGPLHLALHRLHRRRAREIIAVDSYLSEMIPETHPPAAGSPSARRSSLPRCRLPVLLSVLLARRVIHGIDWMAIPAPGSRRRSSADPQPASRPARIAALARRNTESLRRACMCDRQAIGGKHRAHNGQKTSACGSRRDRADAGLHQLPHALSGCLVCPGP